MKSSIKFILTAALFLTATIFSFAQRGGERDHSPEKRADKQTARMVDNLSLNDKQAADVKAINLDFAKKMKEAHVANKGKDREAMKPVRADLEKGRSAALAKVLTATQLETYEAKKSEIKEKIKGKRKVKRGEKMSTEERVEKSTARMVESLSLNQTQAAKVKAINLDYANKRKEAKEANKEKDKSAMKAVKDSLDKGKAMELKKVLTPEQFKTYQEMKAKKIDRKNGGNKKARL